MRCHVLALGVLVLTGCKQQPRGGEAETDALVRDALAKEGCTVKGQEGRTIRATCGDSGAESSMNLENLDASLKAIPDREDRALAVQRFVRNLTGAQNETTPDATPLAALRPTLKTKAALEATFARVSPEVRAKNRLPTWPVAGEVVAVVVVDRPDSMAMVMQPALDKWKTTDAAVWARALENLDAHPLEPKRLERGGVTLAQLEDPEDAYEAARILSPKTRGSLEKMVGGRAVFAIPDREHLVAARADDANAVRVLRDLAKELSAGAYGITAELVEVDAAGALRVVR